MKKVSKYYENKKESTSEDEKVSKMSTLLWI